MGRRYLGPEEKQPKNCWLVTSPLISHMSELRCLLQSPTWGWAARKRLEAGLPNRSRPLPLSPKQSCPSRKDHVELRGASAVSPESC